MATPKPGHIRCPTCHQSTPPAAYCTQCGSPIPESVRARPRGMDRDELQSRIRARRSGLPAFRRGARSDEVLDYAEPYSPEPEDARALRNVDQVAARPLQDLDWEPEPAPDEPAPDQPLPEEPAPDEPRLRRGAFVPEPSHEAVVETRAADEPPPDEPVWPAADIAERRAAEELREDRYPEELFADEPYTESYADRPYPAEPPPALAEGVDTADEVYVDEDYDQYDYAPDEAYYPYEEERRGGSGALAVVGFLALGALALVGGALLWGLLGGAEGVGADATPTPTVTATPAVTPTPPPAATPEPTATATDPAATATPEVGSFADGFAAQAQPCIGEPDLSQHAQGCNSSGTTNDGTLWVWIGFQRGTDDDVLSMRILDQDGEVVGQSDRSLEVIGCGDRCNGWIYFNVRGLAGGEYRVEVHRNGQFATSTGFTVRS